MGPLRRVVGIFLLVGLGMMAGALYWAHSTQRFIERAAVAQGTVIELSLSRSSDSNSYFPVVRFATGTDQNVTFRSSSGSNPPSYRVGESVRVYYDAADPQEAMIDGLFSLWGGALIVGALGTTFTSVGGGVILFQRARARREQYLRRRGRPLQAKVIGVERNTSIRINGRSPWRIAAQWQDPATGSMRVFHSANIWYDPSEHIGTDSVTVWVDQRDVRKYVMDTGFLPKLAG